MFAHLAEGVIPSTPGLCGRTNDQVVVAGFQFDFVVEPVLFQEDFRYAYATRVANPNQSSFHGKPPFRQSNYNVDAWKDRACQIIKTLFLPLPSHHCFLAGQPRAVIS